MACGRAVVSTRIGAEGLNVSDGEVILFADSAKDFAQSISSLLNNPDMALRLGTKARSWVKQNYDWAGIAGYQEDIYRRMLAKKHEFMREAEET
jgi:glycosyltransferase involved in cell wall biosynthesis